MRNYVTCFVGSVLADNKMMVVSFLLSKLVNLKQSLLRSIATARDSAKLISK